MNYKIIIVLIVALLFTSCGKKKEQEKSPSRVDSSFIDETKQELIKIDGSVELHYNLNKGEKFKYRLNSFNKSSQSLFLKDSTISEIITQQMEYIINATVLERDDDGNVTLNLVCESVIAKAESNKGIKMEYDSKNPPQDTSVRKQFFNYEILIGSDFSVRISKIGEILDIYKTDKLVNKILSDLPKQPSSSEKEMLRKNVQDGLIKPLVQQVFKTTTMKKANVDSSWTNPSPCQISVFDLENTARYQV
ncbi:MAG: DUF6263 family protein, partial [Ignavibacteria bacterium]|nr:DUF6263 family protein [Ignavibacteria bacterium]